MKGISIIAVFLLDNWMAEPIPTRRKVMSFFLFLSHELEIKCKKLSKATFSHYSTSSYLYSGQKVGVTTHTEVSFRLIVPLFIVNILQCKVVSLWTDFYSVSVNLPSQCPSCTNKGQEMTPPRVKGRLLPIRGIVWSERKYDICWLFLVFIIFLSVVQ